MSPDFSKGLLPAIVQDAQTSAVLMLGYMNEESFKKTLDTKKVTFYSRSRQCLWTKGETSGNVLDLVDLDLDCDQDALLLKVNPVGATCHRNTKTCFDHDFEFINKLEDVIRERIESKEQHSYVSTLVQSGLDRVIQKVGEEAVEVLIAAKNESDAEFEEESADLIFHLLLLLQVKGKSFSDIVRVLKKRSSANSINT